VLARALRILALACIAPGLFHVVFGVGGDWLIGVDPTSPINPSLDSQNRFYGAAFTAYGFLLWLCAGDLPRYRPVLYVLLAVMFAGGCSRGLAAVAHGWPSWQVMGLWASEVLVPPVIWLWAKRSSP
jgi:Domain of unknown function (DUF4345)